MALVASMAILPHVSAISTIRFCKDGTCPPGLDACPTVTSDLGPGYPFCTIFNTEDLLGGKDYAAAEGG